MYVTLLCHLCLFADPNLVDFPVTIYGGTKSILLSTRTIMGGRNPFLGIAYIVVAGVCIVLGALFTATHLIRPRYVVLFAYSCDYVLTCD